MTRRQWTGLAGVLFGAAMFAGVFVAGTTPESSDAGAVARYTEYWTDTDHQDKAALSAIILTYACVVLALFVGGLRSLLGRLSDSALAPAVLATGTGAAATLAVGAMLLNGAGVASAESGYEPTGSDALLVEAIGYYVTSTGMMMAGAMAVCFSLANRVARVVPQWTIVLSGLLGVVALGSIFVAWIGFMLFPLWAAVMGLCLLLTRGTDTEATAAT